jgi:predicted GIY-YIG superfamily endonuclease
MAGHPKRAASRGHSTRLMAGRGNFSSMAFHVYILRLSNNQLYVGSTEDLARRFAEHQAGSGGRTTALFRPLELVYSEPHPDRASAVKRERQLKRWSRAKKLALIKGNSAELKRLAQCRSTHVEYPSFPESASAGIRPQKSKARGLILVFSLSTGNVQQTQ